MKKNTICGIILTIAACGAYGAAAGNVPDRLAWFREAKFGMFVHWGPYSALGGEWKGRAMPTEENAEWIMQFFRIPAVEYRAAARRFNPARFDAQAWVHLAAQTGMKYLVVTAKHHDGFAMYRSGVSPYNIADSTPFGRDPLIELADACRREGIRFCVYYSHREDWDDPDAYGNDWDYDESKKDFARYLERKSKPQVRELLTKYGPLGLIWFDRGLYTPAQAQQFVDLVRSIQPQCLVNGRVGNYDQELMGDYQVMEDNAMSPGGLNEYWESPQTLNGTWGYSKFDNAWKTPATVVRRLVEIASKGGNYLLDVGPDPDGVFPRPAVDVLRQVGKWMDRNSESIYGTSACALGRLPWGACTVKGTRLYLHVFDWPRDGRLRIQGLKSTPESAHLAGARGRSLAWRRQGSELTIDLPQQRPDDIDSVVVLELAGRPEVEPFVVAQPENQTIRLDYMFAVTTGSAAKRFNRKGAYHIARWTSPADSASWKVRISTPGRFTVRIRYAARPEYDGGEFEVAVGSRTITGAVHPTGDWFEYRTHGLGQVDFERAGEYTVCIRPTVPLTHNLMHFEALELTPGAAPRDLSRGGTVLMLGDSILDFHRGEHRVERVMLRLAAQKTPHAKWTIYNEAHGGQYIGPRIGEPEAVSGPLFETESSGQFFETVARHPEVDAVIVNFAANDGKVYPPEHFRKRLEALAELLERTYPGARLIFSTSMYLDPAHSAPFHPGKSHVAGFRDGGSRSDYLEPYNDQIRQFTAAHGFVLADTYRCIAAETAKGNWDLRMRQENGGDPKDDARHEGDMAWFNNIHPNDRGTAVIAELLLDALTEPVHGELLKRLK